MASLGAVQAGIGRLSKMLPKYDSPELTWLKSDSAPPPDGGRVRLSRIVTYTQRNGHKTFIDPR